MNRNIKYYEIKNISGQDIDFLVTDRSGENISFTFESNETLTGLTYKTIDDLLLNNRELMRYVKLIPVYKWEEDKKVNWIKEGF